MLSTKSKMGTLTLGGAHCKEKNIKRINVHNMSFKPEKKKGFSSKNEEKMKRS